MAGGCVKGKGIGEKKEMQKKLNQQPEEPQAQQSQSNLRQEIFEEVVSRPVKLNTLEKEIVISFMDFTGECQIKTCPGDIYKIVNALMDYSRLLEMVVQEWGLTGYHKAVYEVQAEQLRKIANKFSFGIGYNYYEAVEKCKKRLERQKKKGHESGSSDDVGEEALALTLRHKQKPKKQVNK